MPKFKYRALNTQGRPARGIVEAANESDLFSRLEEGGMTLIDCKEISENAGAVAGFAGKKIKVRDLIQMFIHLEQLQKAGVPLLDALADVRDSAESPKLRDIMADVHRDVVEGNSFSAALAKHPGTFKNIFVSLIAGGEETGNLHTSFAQVIRHLKWTDAIQSKIRKARRYPMILCVVVVIVIWVMMGYVVPQVTGFLKDIGQELPFITLALIATSEFVINYFLYVILGVIAVVIFVKIGCAVSQEFRYRVHYILLNMPLIGQVIRKIALSQFCQTFGILFTSGLDILKCLDAAKNTTGNLVLIESLGRVRQSVQEGVPLSVALKGSGEFPPLVMRMVKIGEESGNLTTVLQQVSEFYDKDVDESVDAMILLIEPILTAVLGITVLWIAAAVFGPIYDSFGKMGG